MFGLIKLIFILLLVGGAALYGGDIWNTVKDKVTEFTNPELQKANVLNSFKSNFSDIENIIKEVNENLDNPDFDKKSKLEESLELLREAKNDLEEIEQTDSGLIEKTFEAARNLKGGVKSLIFEETENGSQNCQCD